MGDKKVTLVLSTDATGLKSGAAEARREIDATAKAAQQANAQIVGSAGQAEGAIRKEGAAAQIAREHVSKLGAAGQAAAAQAANGWRAAASEVGEFAAAATGATRVTGLFARSAAGIGLALIAREALQAADAWTAMTGKLKLATSSQEEFARAQADTFRIAQASAAPIASVVQLYARLSTALKDSGAEQTEIAKLTQTINQALLVSGATIAETASVTTQLSQAFASGVLRGEEFNSVNEASPRIMQALADSLGVTRGELRKLAEEGALTSDLLRKALGEQAGQIAEEASRIPVTVERAMERLKNSTTQLIGEIDQVTGASATLAAGISNVASGIDSLANSIRNARQVSAELAEVSRDVANGMTLMDFAARSAAEGEAEILRRQFEHEQQLQKLSATTVDYLGVLEKYAAQQLGLSAISKGIVSDLKQETAALAQRAFVLKGGDVIEFQTRALIKFNELIGENTDGLKAQLAAYLSQKGAVSALEAGKKALAGAEKLHNEQLREYRERIDMANAGDDERTKYLQEQARLAERQTEAIARSNRAFDDHIRSIRDETRLLLLSGEAREEAERQIQAETVMRRRLNELMQAGVPFLWALAQAQQAYNIELDALTKRDAAAEFDRIRESVERLGDGLKDALGELLSGGTDLEGFFERLGRNSQQFWSQMISDSLKAGESLQEFGARAAQATNLKNPDGSWSAGGIANAVGSGVNLYQAYRQGNPLSGAAAGAQLGMSIGSIIPGIGNLVGGIVGGIVGLIGGLLGGSKAPDLRLGATGIVRKPEDSFSTAFGSMQIGVRGGTNASEFMRLVTEFDAGMADLIGTFRNGSEQLDAVKQALSRWSVDMKGDISAEEVLASRFSAILSAFNSDVQAFVGTAGTLEERVQRLGEAAFIDAAAASGELLDSFGPLATLLTDYRDGTEDLSQTYGRLLESTAGIEAAFGILGIEAAGTRDEFIRFAADLAEAAGGVQQAAALWSAYFETFYDADETREIAQARALSARNTALEAIGLEATISADRFRQLFEAALPSLTPDEIVQWLRAGAAIGAYNTAVQASADAAEAAAAPLRELRQTLDGFAAGIDQQFTELARSGLSDFQREMLSIDDNLRGNVSQLQAWRAQLVANGGSAADLARVDGLLGRAHELAAAQAARAIAMLRDAGRSLVTQLTGGSGSTDVTTAAQGMADAGVSAFQTIGEAAQDLASQQLAALQRIREYLDAQLLGDLASLTPGQQYAEAQAQFAAALAAAQGGDANALASITGLADTLLRLSRERFAGGGQYITDEASIRAALQGLLGLQSPGGTPGATGAGGFVSNMGGFQQIATDVSQQTSSQLELGQQITEIIRDLLSATGESLGEVAASLGLNLSDLVSALGINLTDLSVQTATSLSGLASNLGVELTDLSQQVGVDLGQLADAQSLMNDAVELAIGKLPADQSARLRPLLEAVEQAAAVGGPEMVEDAIEALEAETRRIGGAAALALAPYLDGIDPTDPLTSIDGVMRLQLGTLGDIYTLLQQWLTAGAAPTPIPTDSPPEPITVTPGKTLSVISAGAIPSALLAVRSPEESPTEKAMLAEMRAMRAELAELRRTVATGTAGTTQAVRETGTQQARAIEQQTRAQNSRRTTTGG